MVKQKDRKKPIQLKRKATSERKMSFRFIWLSQVNDDWSTNTWRPHMLKSQRSCFFFFLLKKVSMKMPSFPILSWSASSKSSLATKSSSCGSSTKHTGTYQLVKKYYQFFFSGSHRLLYRDSSSDQGDGSLLFVPLSFIVGRQAGGHAVGGRVGKSSIFLVF